MNIAVWYFCFLLAYKASLALYAKIKQKYQNCNLHRKLKFPTSEIESKLPNPRAARVRCMEEIYGNLRKPAHAGHARAMPWFWRGQEYSTAVQRRAYHAVFTAAVSYPRYYKNIYFYDINKPVNLLHGGTLLFRVFYIRIMYNTVYKLHLKYNFPRFRGGIY